MDHSIAIPAGVIQSQKKVWNLLKVNKKDKETTSRHRSDVFVVNFAHISHFVFV